LGLLIALALLGDPVLHFVALKTNSEGEHDGQHTNDSNDDCYYGFVEIVHT
jgi:hypothetical protein